MQAWLILISLLWVFMLLKAGHISVTRNSPQCWVQSSGSGPLSSFVSFHSSSVGLAIAFCSYLSLHLHPRVGGDWNWYVTRGARNIGLIGGVTKILRLQNTEFNHTRHETKVYIRTSLTRCFEPCPSHCCFENEIGWSTNIISESSSPTLPVFALSQLRLWHDFCQHMMNLGLSQILFACVEINFLHV